MATTVLPTRTDGAQLYSFSAPLGGTNFGFVFTWNARDSAWYLQLSDDAGNLLLAKKIALGTPMLWRHADRRLPLGELVAVDTSGSGAEPGLTDLGSRVLLTFTDAADIANGV